MIKITFFPLEGGTRFSEFELNSLKQGLDFILFSLENISEQNKGRLSISIQDKGNENFPTINFQQNSNMFFLQMYDNSAENEGWHTLVNSDFKKSDDDLVSTVWDEPTGNYFKTRFADGVLFSTSLLVSKETIENLLTSYCEDVNKWRNNGKWENLGLISFIIQSEINLVKNILLKFLMLWK